MHNKKKESHLTTRAALLSAAGLVGTMLWQKKDVLKAIVQLRQYPEGWVMIQKEPEVFLTRTNEASKENLFDYLATSPWRLVDQVADGYFWINQQEEILLLTQKRVMKDYWSWTASRPVFADAAPGEDVQAPESVIDDADYDYDMTQF